MSKEQLDAETRGEIEDKVAEIQAMEEGPEKEAAKSIVHEVIVDLMQDYDAPIDPKGPLDYGVEAATRAMDFGSGLVRTGALAQPSYYARLLKDMATHGMSMDTLRKFAEKSGKEHTTPFHDMVRAVQGGAPDTDEHLARQGIPEGRYSELLPEAFSKDGEGMTLQRGGWADRTARGTVGMLGDIALSATPLAKEGGALETLLGKSRGANAARAVMDPSTVAFELAGKKYYGSAFGDEAGPAAAEIAYREGVKAPLTRKGLIAKLDEMIEGRRRIRSEIAARADEDTRKAMGIKYPKQPPLIDRADYYVPGVDEIEQARGTAGKSGAADHVSVEFDQNTPRDRRFVGVEQAVEDQRGLQERARAAGRFDPPGSSGGASSGELAARQKIRKQAYGRASQAAADEAEKTLDLIRPGEGAEFRKHGREASTLITSAQDVGAPQSAWNFLTPGKVLPTLTAPIGYLMMSQGGANTLPALLTAAGAAALTSTPAKIAGGYALRKGAPLLGTAVRQGLLQSYGDRLNSETDWAQMLKSLQPRKEK